MSNKELITRQEITPSIWEMIKEIAPAMQASRLFGVKNPEEAMAIMLKGYELGFSLTASFEFVNVINGRPGLSPRGMLALIQQSPNLAGMKIEDINDDKGNPSSCRVTMARINGFSYTTEFSMDNAKSAGLIKPDSGWSKYPANMLRWRTIGYCADVVFPDIGMKRIDELGSDITKEGEVWKPEPVIETIPNYNSNLTALMKDFSTEEIISANGGSMPVTPEQINQTAHYLFGILEAYESQQEDKNEPATT